MIVCPTVTSQSKAAFEAQLATAAYLSKRIHIDCMDGIFTPSRSPGLEDIVLPKGILCDIHLMYLHPGNQLTRLIALKPHMVIIHAEAIVDHAKFRNALALHGIKTGVALLQESAVHDNQRLITDCDHCLIFSGHLGYHGGKADLRLLEKVIHIRNSNHNIEIGWDGGLTTASLREVVAGGVDVANVGGAIQESADPLAAYDEMRRVIAEFERGMVS